MNDVGGKSTTDIVMHHQPLSFLHIVHKVPHLLVPILRLHSNMKYPQPQIIICIKIVHNMIVYYQRQRSRGAVEVRL